MPIYVPRAFSRVDERQSRPVQSSLRHRESSFFKSVPTVSSPPVALSHSYNDPEQDLSALKSYIKNSYYCYSDDLKKFAVFAPQDHSFQATPLNYLEILSTYPKMTAREQYLFLCYLGVPTSLANLINPDIERPPIKPCAGILALDFDNCLTKFLTWNPSYEYGELNADMQALDLVSENIKQGINFDLGGKKAQQLCDALTSGYEVMIITNAYDVELILEHLLDDLLFNPVFCTDPKLLHRVHLITCPIALQPQRNRKTKAERLGYIIHGLSPQRFSFVNKMPPENFIMHYFDDSAAHITDMRDNLVNFLWMPGVEKIDLHLHKVDNGLNAIQISHSKTNDESNIIDRNKLDVFSYNTLSCIGSAIESSEKVFSPTGFSLPTISSTLSHFAIPIGASIKCPGESCAGTIKWPLRKCDSKDCKVSIDRAIFLQSNPCVSFSCRCGAEQQERSLIYPEGHCVTCGVAFTESERDQAATRIQIWYRALKQKANMDAKNHYDASLKKLLFVRWRFIFALKKELHTVTVAGKTSKGPRDIDEYYFETAERLQQAKRLLYNGTDSRIPSGFYASEHILHDSVPILFCSKGDCLIKDCEGSNYCPTHGIPLIRLTYNKARDAAYKLVRPLVARIINVTEMAVYSKQVASKFSQLDTRKSLIEGSESLTLARLQSRYKDRPTSSFRVLPYDDCITVADAFIYQNFNPTELATLERYFTVHSLPPQGFSVGFCTATQNCDRPVYYSGANGPFSLRSDKDGYYFCRCGKGLFVLKAKSPEMVQAEVALAAEASPGSSASQTASAKFVPVIQKQGSSVSSHSVYSPFKFRSISASELPNSDSSNRGTDVFSPVGSATSTEAGYAKKLEKFGFFYQHNCHLGATKSYTTGVVSSGTPGATVDLHRYNSAIAATKCEITINKKLAWLGPRQGQSPSVDSQHFLAYFGKPLLPQAGSSQQVRKDQNYRLYVLDFNSILQKDASSCFIRQNIVDKLKKYFRAEGPTSPTQVAIISDTHNLDDIKSCLTTAGLEPSNYIICIHPNLQYGPDAFKVYSSTHRDNQITSIIHALFERGAAINQLILLHSDSTILLNFEREYGFRTRNDYQSQVLLKGIPTQQPSLKLKLIKESTIETFSIDGTLPIFQLSFFRGTWIEYKYT